VYKLEGGTFFAYLILRQGGQRLGRYEHHKIDCRPSDAIAIAVRMTSPIFVEEDVLRVAGQDSMPQEDGRGRRGGEGARKAGMDFLE